MPPPEANRAAEPNPRPLVQTAALLKTIHGDISLIASHPLVIGQDLKLLVDGAEPRLLVAPISSEGGGTVAVLPDLLTLAPVTASAGDAVSALSPRRSVVVPPPLTSLGTFETTGLSNNQTTTIGLPPGIAALPIGARFVATVVPMPRPGVILLVADQATFSVTVTPDPAPPRPARAPVAYPHPSPLAGARVELEIRGTVTHLITKLSTIGGARPPGSARIVELVPIRANVAQAHHGTGAISPYQTAQTKSNPGLSLGDTVRATAQQATSAPPPVPPRSSPSTADQPKPTADRTVPLAPAGTSIMLALRGYGTSTTAGTQATVLGHARGGDLLVRMSDTVLSLETRAPFPPGTALTFEVIADHPRRPDIVLPPPPALVGQPISFEALDETLHTLAAADPAVHASAMSTAVPNSGGSGGAMANIIAYLLGMQSGETRQWLGERAAQTLERTGRAALLGRVGDEIRQAARGGDVQPGEWRQIPVPFHDGDRVTALTVWLMGPQRHHDDDPSHQSPDDEMAVGTRLFVDLSLSRLGPMQLDGYYLDNRLDLTIRFETPLVDAAQVNLNTVFDDVLAIAGLTGTLSFAGLAVGKRDEI